MNGPYYPGGSMLGSGIDDYEKVLYYVCTEYPCVFDGDVDVVIRGTVARGFCPSCDTEFEVEGIR